MAPTTTVVATFDIAVSGAALELRRGGAPIAGATTYDEQSRTLTFTPTDPLA